MYSQNYSVFWAKGLRALLYLDDGIVTVAGKENEEKASCKVRKSRISEEHSQVFLGPFSVGKMAWF